MSRDAREWVWENSSSRATARCVMLSIADRVVDDQCIAWASLSSLAERTNASISTVREAIARLITVGELEDLKDLAGPQGSTVYRMPLAAQALQEQREDNTDAPSSDSEALLTHRVSALRRYGIRRRRGPKPITMARKPAIPETGSAGNRQTRKPAPRRTGNRHSGVPEIGTQNRSEPELNRKYSSGAAVIPAAEWQVDLDTQTWVQQQGHLDRLGEDGVQAADAKWRLHRADWEPRSPDAWAADWRAWVAREHPPTPRGAHAGLGSGHRASPCMTRTEAHQAALLAAL
ncbi:helix-turn-helix domain-containing protein [Streptomyces sp. NPDC047024]|uniref:helix-turn-helix domain-containing protein n=1 Tax=Streptomyces sp. NPDC047024 TaxID=3155476 RepID=UPI0033C4DE2A